MNEQLQAALSELINKANGGLDAGTDFLVAEIPDVIQQLLLWYGCYNFILFVVGTAFPAMWVYLTLVKFREKIHDSLQHGGEPFWAFIMMPPFFVGIFCTNVTWLQIWIAPKIWLIEYAANLAK